MNRSLCAIDSHLVIKQGDQGLRRKHSSKLLETLIKVSIPRDICTSPVLQKLQASGKDKKQKPENQHLLHTDYSLIHLIHIN